jgi:hypothetical protein
VCHSAYRRTESDRIWLRALRVFAAYLRGVRPDADPGNVSRGAIAQSSLHLDNREAFLMTRHPEQFDRGSNGQPYDPDEPLVVR